jgi:hypothetical protein
VLAARLGAGAALVLLALPAVAGLCFFALGASSLSRILEVFSSSGFTGDGGLGRGGLPAAALGGAGVVKSSSRSSMMMSFSHSSLMLGEAFPFWDWLDCLFSLGVLNVDVCGSLNEWRWSLRPPAFSSGWFRSLLPSRPWLVSICGSLNESTWGGSFGAEAGSIDL